MKTLLTFLFVAVCPAPPDSLLLVSWNVENFLDYRTDSTGRYTAGRFYNKCIAVSKTLLLIAERCGRLPDAVALTEVGDRFVLERLLGSTPLRKLDYSIVHYESPDRRGIDCALLYRRSCLRLRRSSPKHLTDSTGKIMPTRDILLAEFDSLDILVNHHPSKVGGDSERRRTIAQRRMWALIDSLQASGHGRIVSVGDFNDDVWGSPGAPGTIKYNGAWEKIDGGFALGLTVRESVFADPLLSEPDRSFGGTKPRRTFIGPRYNGGVSDHYPIIFWIKKSAPAPWNPQRQALN
ncbi:MAG: hypothetical protein J6S97_04295 [Bacteroidales bacterium]|nr:hypothetical protein [Bacteroidales bacterium]